MLQRAKQREERKLKALNRSYTTICIQNHIGVEKKNVTCIQASRPTSLIISFQSPNFFRFKEYACLGSSRGYFFLPGALGMVVEALKLKPLHAFIFSVKGALAAFNKM